LKGKIEGYRDKVILTMGGEGAINKKLDWAEKKKGRKA